MSQILRKTMKAVGFYKHLPICHKESLLDLEVPVPKPGPKEVLVEVKVIAVNPIDMKERAPKGTDYVLLDKPKILGRDGAGVIVDKGEHVTCFNKGDQVIFTGDPRRDGCNAEFVVLNEILIAPKPKSLTFEEAAAMPLTSVTAYEALYDRLLLSEKDEGKTLLIINSAGGMGSVAAQLAKNLGMKVIGTASREESKAFALKYRIDVVLNHKNDLIPQLEDLGYSKDVDYILNNYDPSPYWDTMMKAIKPQGKICILVDASTSVDIRPLKDKSVTLTSHSMITRIKYNTDDNIRHHEILKTISTMLENGSLKTTLSKVLTPINAKNLKEAHQIMEQQSINGKLVISGF